MSENYLQSSTKPPIRSRKNRGFTLVEMIVALGLFAVVAVVALGALVKIISVNQKAQSLQASMTNLNFALESISRELRVSTLLFCGSASAVLSSTLSLNNTCAGVDDRNQANGTLFAFNSSKALYDNGNNVLCRLMFAYRFRKDGAIYRLEKAEQTDCNTPISESYFSSILDENVTITDYSVKVIDGGTTDRLYPLIFLQLSGYAGDKERTRSYFDLQTAISPRVPR